MQDLMDCVSDVPGTFPYELKRIMSDQTAVGTLFVHMDFRTGL